MIDPNWAEEIERDKRVAAEVEMAEERIRSMALASDDAQWAVAWALIQMGHAASDIGDQLHEISENLCLIANWDIAMIGRAGE